jgi:hypothetical protein
LGDRIAHDHADAGRAAEMVEHACLDDRSASYGSALRWRIGRPGVSVVAAATMALASIP